MTPIIIRLNSYKKRTIKALFELNHMLKQNKFNFLKPSTPGPHVAILMYHGVVKEQPDKFNYRHVSCSDFEVQLKLLKQHCNVISVKDLFLNKLSTERLNVVITFDDGFKNNFLYAAPILEKYNLPASFYVTGSTDDGFEWLWPDFLNIMSRHVFEPVEICGRIFKNNGKFFKDINSDELLSDIIRYSEPTWEFKKSMYSSFQRWIPNMYRPDYRPFWELMNVEEIKALANNPLFTIGCHGYFHNNLGSLDLKDAMDELIKSKQYLEKILKSSIDELAYPDGSYTKDLVQMAKNHGFPFQLGVSPLFSEPSTCSHPAFRFGIYSFTYPRIQLVEMLQHSFKWEK